MKNFGAVLIAVLAAILGIDIVVKHRDAVRVEVLHRENSARLAALTPLVDDLAAKLKKAEKERDEALANVERLSAERDNAKAKATGAPPAAAAEAR